MSLLISNDPDWNKLDNYLEKLVNESKLNQQTTRPKIKLKTIKIKYYEKRSN